MRNIQGPSLYLRARSAPFHVHILSFINVSCKWNGEAESKKKTKKRKKKGPRHPAIGTVRCTRREGQLSFLHARRCSAAVCVNLGQVALADVDEVVHVHTGSRVDHSNDKREKESSVVRASAAPLCSSPDGVHVGQHLLFKAVVHVATAVGRHFPKRVFNALEGLEPSAG